MNLGLGIEHYPFILPTFLLFSSTLGDNLLYMFQPLLLVVVLIVFIPFVFKK